MPISARVSERISTQIKKYTPILNQLVTKDVNEADTGAIIREMLCCVLGYDNHNEITAEKAIKGAKADFAVMVDGTVRFLIEAKAIGISLNDHMVRQIVDYGANLGTDWVLLTNGVKWNLYKIHFDKPIGENLLCEIDVLNSTPKSAKLAELIECFGNLSRENFSTVSMNTYFLQKQLTSKFAVAAVLLSEPMLKEVRHKLRKMSPGLKVDVEYLETLLSNEVIKRELIDGDEGKTAQALIKHLQKKLAKDKEGKEPEEKSSDQPVVPGITQS
jgi:hypothetical protein